jgi:hypothetical protein
MVKPVYLDTSVPAGVEVVNPMEVLDPTGCLVTDSRLLQPGVGSDVTVPIGQHRAARPWLRWKGSVSRKRRRCTSSSMVSQRSQPRHECCNGHRMRAPPSTHPRPQDSRHRRVPPPRPRRAVHVGCRPWPGRGQVRGVVPATGHSRVADVDLGSRSADPAAPWRSWKVQYFCASRVCMCHGIVGGQRVRPSPMSPRRGVWECGDARSEHGQRVVGWSGTGA